VIVSNRSVTSSWSVSGVTARSSDRKSTEVGKGGAPSACFR
jgi:hypothetical protein